MATKSEVEAIVRGITPALVAKITESVEFLSAIITEQRKAISKLEQRVSDLEGVTDDDTAAQRSIEGAGGHLDR